MRVLTLNNLKSPLKSVNLGYPMGVEIQEMQVVETECNVEFVRHMISSLHWPGIIIAATAVGLEGFPENINDELINDDDFIQALHHLLLDIHIIEGTLICPETGYRFPIHEGIPKFLKASVSQCIRENLRIVEKKANNMLRSASSHAVLVSSYGWGMDVLTMALFEKHTTIPLDLVVLINSFVYEKLTDENFKEAIALWFENEEKCKWRFGYISEWNTSRVTNMMMAFYLQKRFNEDISRWNVRKVTNMSRMFSMATRFNSDLSHWNVGNVTTMAWMFHGATHFESDLSHWDVSNVEDMSYMFYQATRFNADLSQWNVSRVTDMRAMFSEACQFNGDLRRWDTRNVTKMNLMFSGARRFDGDLSDWNVSEDFDLGIRSNEYLSEQIS